jgi:hypothetical protein
MASFQAGGFGLRAIMRWRAHILQPGIVALPGFGEINAAVARRLGLLEHFPVTLKHSHSGEGSSRIPAA